MAFAFRSAGTIHFGRDGLEHVGEIARALGTRAMIVRGGRHLDASGTASRLA